MELVHGGGGGAGQGRVGTRYSVPMLSGISGLIIESVDK